MLVIDCPTHGSKVLLSERRIRRLRNADSEIIVDAECWCGTRMRIHTGGKVHTGERESASQPVREAASLSR
jgi:hypothetical protein